MRSSRAARQRDWTLSTNQRSRWRDAQLHWRDCEPRTQSETARRCDGRRGTLLDLARPGGFTLPALIDDLWHALRVFTKHPGYLVTAVLTLALGIGFTTAVFTVINAVMLRPLPYAQPDRLVRLIERNLPRFPQFSVSPGHYLFWREHATAFDGIGVWAAQSSNLDTGTGDPDRVRADSVSGNLFDVLGVRPTLGRTLTEADEREGAPAVAVLSHGAWQRRFGGRGDVIGQMLLLDRKQTTIVGVMPSDFEFNGRDSEMWVPFTVTAAARRTYGSHFLTGVARLKAGKTRQQAEADLQSVSRQLASENPDSAGWDVLVFDLRDYSVRNVKTMLYVLLGASSFVLLIACANVANLLLVRGAGRQRELAIRSAIGASRARLLRQLLVEQLVLASMSAAAGVLAAAWLVRLLLALTPRALPRQEAIGIDAGVLLFALTLSILTPLLFGLLPALRGSRPDLRSLLSAGRSGPSLPARRVRTAIVTVEIALATVLLVGAGLLLRSFARLIEVSPGFESRGAVLAGVSLPSERYPQGEARERFFATFLERVEGLPQVAAVGLTMPMPMVSDFNSGLEIEGETVPPEGAPLTLFYGVSPGYFAAMRIPLLKGRLISADDRRGAPRVVVINQTLADRHFPGVNPLGRRIRVGQGDNNWREIVGVVGDVKQFGLDQPDRPQVYESYLQHPYFASFSVVVRSRGADPTAVIPDVRGVLRTIDAELPLAPVRTLESLVDSTTRPQRFSTALIGLFSGAALLLAVIGIFSVMAHSVGLRTQEFAIRVAHGAGRTDIFWLVLRNAATMTAGGLAGGLASAWLMRDLVGSLLFGVTAADGATYTGVVAALTLSALVASAVPALRAASVDPIVALRLE